QAFRPDGFSEDELTLAQSVVDTSANYFAHARHAGVRRPGPEEPKFTLVSGTGPVVPAQREHVAMTPQPPAPRPLPAELPASDPRQEADQIMAELLRDLGALGSPNAFAVVADDDGTALRGHSVSDWAFMKQLDAAVGIA